LFELPGFQLKSVSLEGPNENLLRAKFTYDLTDTETKKQCSSDCVMDFDLGMYCLPTKLHQSYKVGSKQVTHDWERQWVTAADNSYTVKRAFDGKTTSDSVTTQVTKIRTDMNVNTRDLPETDFALSAFGFPEPPGIDFNKPFPYYLLAGGIGIVCLGAFIFVRSRARRERAVS